MQCHNKFCFWAVIFVVCKKVLRREGDNRVLVLFWLSSVAVLAEVSRDCGIGISVQCGVYEPPLPYSLIRLNTWLFGFKAVVILCTGKKSTSFSSNVYKSRQDLRDGKTRSHLLFFSNGLSHQDWKEQYSLINQNAN